MKFKVFQSIFDWLYLSLPWEANFVELKNRLRCVVTTHGDLVLLMETINFSSRTCCNACVRFVEVLAQWCQSFETPVDSFQLLLVQPRLGSATSEAVSFDTPVEAIISSSDT